METGKTAEQNLPHSAPIHVMDREADQYLLLNNMISSNYRFVIRTRVDRAIEWQQEKRRTLKHAIASMRGQMTREVNLSRKDPSSGSDFNQDACRKAVCLRRMAQ